MCLRIKVYIVTVLLLSFNNKLHAQAPTKVDALNTYIRFLNESIHGMFTAHALLGISNSEVNKYIDLDSYAINQLRHDEVQTNLFDKSDKANYTTFNDLSPMELSKLAKTNSRALDAPTAQKLNGKVDHIVNILNKVNQIRLDIDAFIASHDLNEKESIYAVFEILEEAVSLFENYEKAHHALVTEINKLDNKPALIHASAKKMHQTVKQMLTAFRNERGPEAHRLLDNLKGAYTSFQSNLEGRITQNQENYRNGVEMRIENIIKLVSSYPEFEVPKEYALNGKDYYFHNQISRRYFNWSGPGFVRPLNDVLYYMDNTFILLDEEPLIFKIAYPMKEEALEVINPELNRKINKPRAPQRTASNFSKPEIIVDSNIVQLEVYDHNMIDRDSISISFNGQWIVENLSLKEEPYKFTVQLEEGKENILLFKAQNMGIIAPNTAALAYRYQGQRKRILIETDLFELEAIKINLNKDTN